jgi:seryl-tRNA synthetase
MPEPTTPRRKESARRRDAAKALEDLRVASKELRQLLGRLESASARAIRQIEAGASAHETALSMSVADRRETLNAAAANLRRARYDFQQAMFRIALLEGESMNEVARTWRVSRQLVSRVSREI